GRRTTVLVPLVELYIRRGGCRCLVSRPRKRLRRPNCGLRHQWWCVEIRGESGCAEWCTSSGDLRGDGRSVERHRDWTAGRPRISTSELIPVGRRPREQSSRRDGYAAVRSFFLLDNQRRQCLSRRPGW